MIKCILNIHILMYQFFFSDTATSEIYTDSHTLSLHDALPSSATNGAVSRLWIRARISMLSSAIRCASAALAASETSRVPGTLSMTIRSEEHTSELQSLMRISYAVLCLQKYNHISLYAMRLYLLQSTQYSKFVRAHFINT